MNQIASDNQNHITNNHLKSITNKQHALPPVLDVCCGSRAMWFDKSDPRATYLDRRKEECEVVSKGRTRTITISPDIQCDFTSIPFPDASFWHVVFDPPHHTSKHLCGEVTSNTQKYYGVLIPGWEEMLAQGFRECFRVLKPNGTLIFKWGSREIPLEQILAMTPHKPLYGHRSGKKAQTHWIAFIKPENYEPNHPIQQPLTNKPLQTT